MTLDKYQELALSTCMESSDNDIYAINGLTAEVGEINDKVAKWIRKGWISIEGNCINFSFTGEDLVGEFADEVGDALWFVALLAHRMGYTLEEIASRNIAKLASRKERGVIDGSGDNR